MIILYIFILKMYNTFGAPMYPIYYMSNDCVTFLLSTLFPVKEKEIGKIICSYLDYNYALPLAFISKHYYHHIMPDFFTI